MVSYEQHDAVDVVGRGLNGRQDDERIQASAAVLAERLSHIHRLGGLFEQVSFSPQMEALLSARSAQLAV